MALKDLLQSQKTIRELKTETAALRLEKAEAARQKEQLEAHAAAVSREADREAAGPPAGADRSGGSRPKSPL